MNKGALITDLKTMIGPSVSVDDTKLSVWVNDGYMYMVDEILKVNPDFFAKSATTSTINSQREYQLPSDFEKALMVNIQIDGEWKRVRPMGDGDIRFIPRHADTASGQGFSWSDPQYYIYGDYIGIMPIPDESVGSALKLWYTYTPSELSSDSDSPDVPAKYHRFLKYWAYANWLDRQEEHVAAERMRQRFEAMVEKMVENLESRQEDEVRSVEIVGNRDLYTDDTYI